MDLDSLIDEPTSELLLTYAELEERLGVSPDGTRAKAKRSGRSVSCGNDGKARVRVATVELSKRPPEREQCLLQQTENSPARFAALEQALIELIAALRKRAANAELEVEQARAELSHLREQLIRLKAEQASVKAAAVVAVEAAKGVAEAAVAAQGEVVAEVCRTLEHERSREQASANLKGVVEERATLALTDAEVRQVRRELIGKDLGTHLSQQPWWRRVFG